jgi:Polysaccharide biosynthesis C-terminal domain
MHRMRTLSILVIASSISNVAITVYFVHFLHMGAVGSALGTLISTSVWTLCVMWKFGLDLLGLKFGVWFKSAVWQGVLPSLVSGLFALGWSYWLPPDTIPELILTAAIMACVYALTILLLCLDEDEYRQLNQLFAKLSSQKAY